MAKGRPQCKLKRLEGREDVDERTRRTVANAIEAAITDNVTCSLLYK